MTPRLSVEEIRETVLIDGLPPGSRDLLDFDNPASNVYAEAHAEAQSLKEHGFDPIATLRDETIPTTATADLATWETALALDGTKVAKSVFEEARRAQIQARLREGGTPSIPNITAALAAVCGNTTSFEIREHARAALTAANTYTNATSASVVGGGSITQSVTAADNAPASQAGARLVFVNLTASDLADLTITLTGPDSTAVTWDATTPAALRPINTADPLTFFAKAFAGAASSGTWTLTVSSASGDFAFTSWALFVEGIGRSAAGVDGLAANAFEWVALVDPSQINPATFDLSAARVVVQRSNPAHCRGYLALKNQNGGDAMTFDDTNTPFNGGIWE